MKITTALATTREPAGTTTPQPDSPAKASHSRFRPDVQALRALAVALVVIYHLWPTALPGGFVGVDAFFVISGFLITSQLSREAESTGGIRLLNFWARRMRRLLPAALLVLLVVALLVWLVVPEGLWQQFYGEIGGSSVYIQNWVLVSDSVNYFSANNGASPVQNFWSLSVEEQFYLVWPLLIIVPLLIPAKRSVKRGLTIGLLVVGTLASFAYGIHATHANSSVSYLATTDRAWEFGIGGLLAFVTIPQAVPARAKAALSWAGLAAIVLSAFVYDGSTPFPGTAALLPVLGVLAVIAAGTPDVRWAPTRLMGLRPVQGLGDISYSLYLWHWPLIVLVPFVVLKYDPSYAGLDTPAKFAILGASLCIAWLSKRYVEDPTRFATFLAKHKPRRTFLVMAGAMAIVVGVSGLGWNVVQLDDQTSAAAETSLLAQKPACFGAAALDPATAPCSNAALAKVLIPTPVTASAEIPQSCMIQTDSESTPTICYTGVSAKKAVKTVALIGDSHAAQWLPALQIVAAQNDWRIVEILKGSCAFNEAPRFATTSFARSCAAWNVNVQKKLASMPEVSAVFTSADIEDLFTASTGSSGFANGVSGYEETWNDLPASISNVYVFKDTPRPTVNVQTCLQLLTTAKRLAPGACGQSRQKAVAADPLVTAAAADPSKATLLDLTDFFCTTSQCDPVVGHVLVYRDADHMTTTYAKTLAPYVLADLQKAS